MIPVAAYRDQTAAVIGLARSGLTAARALQAGGASVICWDDNEEAQARAKAEGLTVTDLNARDWSDLAAVVLSPGFPLTHPEPHRYVKMAESVDVPVIGDIELFALAVNALPESQRPRVIGITGTNGKSTTTALLGHLFHHAGLDAQVGGNIGRGVLDLDPPHSGAVYVLELSSYQLDLAHSLRCDAALLLNVSPDHLDRHGGMEGYVRAKTRIFQNQRPTDAAILGVDDQHTRRIATGWLAKGERNVIPVSSGRALSRGVYALGGALYDATGTSVRQVAELDAVETLPGRHNHQNIAAAFAAACAAGLSADAIRDGLKSFPGLAHRLEKIAEIDGVAFVNDSKATNFDAVRQALAVYGNIYWIAGGRAKDESLKSLSDLFPRISKAYLIGEAQDGFARGLKDAMPVDKSGDMETAVARALADARASSAPDPVVLLSPGCASFDQFKDFEDRGDTFRRIVERITRDSASIQGASA